MSVWGFPIIWTKEARSLARSSIVRFLAPRSRRADDDKSRTSQAGEVALPGGKMDPEDDNLEATARREAQEEVGLPNNPTQVEHLTALRPFLTRGYLLVTPIVCFIKDYALQVRPPLPSPSFPLLQSLTPSSPFPAPIKPLRSLLHLLLPPLRLPLLHPRSILREFPAPARQRGKDKLPRGARLPLVRQHPVPLS